MAAERLRLELEKAREKAAIWQARAKDIERRIREQENMEILRAVRSVAATPEELGEVLAAIRQLRPPRPRAEAGENEDRNEEGNGYEA